MPSLPRNDKPSEVYRDTAEALASVPQKRELAVAQTPMATVDVPLVENAPQVHTPNAVDDPLGNWKQRVRRRK